MDLGKYNTRVRQAISDEYAKCSKKKQEYRFEYSAALERLATERDTLPYSDYRRLEADRDYFAKMIQVEEVKLNVWDMAREICLRIADEETK